MPAIGTAACLACKRELVVKQNERGALNFSCAHCDLSCYAKEGTEAKKRLLPNVKAYEQAAAPAAAGSPAAKAAPAKAGGFGY